MRPIFLKNFTLISAVTIGGIIEWYELFLFIHWHDLFTKLFFSGNPILATYNVLFIFFVGFLGRPVGAIVFGEIGDRLGRKIAFTSSVALMILPSFLIGGIGWILPATGISVAITLCILRFIQGMAVGAELPGAMCYLAECAPKKERVYFCSFTFVGSHIGVLLSLFESYILDSSFSEHFVETYGWRLSFIFGGIMALMGVFFRNKLEESLGFQLIKEKKQLSKNPISDAIFKHWKKLLECFFVTVLPAVSYFMIIIFIEIYLNSFIEINRTNNLLISMIIVFLLTFSLPFWGKFSNKYSLRKLFIISSLGILLLTLSLPFFDNIVLTILAFLFILFFINFQCAILPGYIADLFPTLIRYTGIALSFSLCDGLFGGGTPWLGGLLIPKIGIKMTYVIFNSIASLITLLAFFLTRKRASI